MTISKDSILFLLTYKKPLKWARGKEKGTAFLESQMASHVVLGIWMRASQLSYREALFICSFTVVPC